MPRAPISVAATSTLAMVRAAEARGVRTADLLRAEGITRELLDDPDARLPGPTVLSIWNVLRERAGDPTLQLAAPACLPFGAYRVIDYLVGASATVGDGVQRFASYFRLIADAITLTIVDEGEEHCLDLAMADGGAVPPVYVDYVFAALITRIRMQIRPGVRVHRVELRQPEPSSTSPYADIFRAPVRFGAPADRLCFSADEWRAPMDSADASLARLLEDHARILAERMPHEGSDFVAAVRKTITSEMPNGATAAAVARALNVSVRTLQRKLVIAGTTFREVSDAVRAQLAQEYLSDPRVSIAEVALLLGFSEQASFHRAFRRWTRESPGRWRRGRSGTLAKRPGSLRGR
jgi:AraC-like DNA-binding protein